MNSPNLICDKKSTTSISLATNFTETGRCPVFNIYNLNICIEVKHASDFTIVFETTLMKDFVEPGLDNSDFFPQFVIFVGDFFVYTFLLNVFFI